MFLVNDLITESHHCGTVGQCIVKCTLRAEIKTELTQGNNIKGSWCSEHVLETSPGCSNLFHMFSGEKKKKGFFSL